MPGHSLDGLAGTMNQLLHDSGRPKAGWAPGRRSHQVAAWHAGPGEIAADVISRQCFELELRFGFGAVGQRYKSQAAAAQVPAAIAAAGVQAERFGRACGVRGPFEDHLGIARPDALAAGLAARIVGDADVAQRAAVGDRKSTRLNSSP